MLTSNNQPKQTLALISLEKLPAKQAVCILNASQVLDSPNPQIRLTALATLGKLGEQSEAHSLTRALQSDEDDTVRSAAAGALGDLFHDERKRTSVLQNVVATLSDAALHDEHFMVRYVAIVSLGSVGALGNVQLLLTVAQNTATPALELAAALTALGEAVTTERVTAPMRAVVHSRARDRDDFVRAAVARTLGRWHDAGDDGAVLRRMREEEERFGASGMVMAILDDVLRDLV